MNRTIRAGWRIYFLIALFCLPASGVWAMLWTPPNFPSLRTIIAVTLAPMFALWGMVAKTRITVTDEGIVYERALAGRAAARFADITRVSLDRAALRIQVRGAAAPIRIPIIVYEKEDLSFLADALKTKLAGRL